MRSGKRLAWAIALSALVGCGGKVIEGQTGEGGTGGTGATGGSGGYGGTGGWGGHTDGGAGGGYGGGYGGYGGGDGGWGGGYGGSYGGAGGSYGGYGGGGYGGSATCAFQMGWPQCEYCVYNKCGAECSDCSADWECNQALQCFTKCGPTDQSCLQSCVDSYPNAMGLLQKLFGDCMGMNCEYECSNPGGSGGGGYGGSGGYGGGYGGYGGGYGGYAGSYGGSGGGPLCPMQLGYYQCDQCIGQQCMAECTKCAYSPDCQNLFNCMIQCSDEQCQNDCVSKYPNGIDALIELFGADQGCVVQKCMSQCGG